MKVPSEEGGGGISRRDAIQRMGVWVGGALSAPTLSALLSGCEVRPVTPEWTPEVLGPDQLDLLSVAVDRIIPPTDTPGARESGVPAFIDLLLHRWVEPVDRDRFLAGLAGLDDLSGVAYGLSFLEASAEQQTSLLARLDEEAVQARREEADPLPFFATLKEWTLVGYYTSEVGATRELRWLSVPGRYQGDIPLDDVGRAWA